MRPLRLYIFDFSCYERAFIDFSQFSSALVVGIKENNDMYSNGVGKTTIFKAMEYVLFNQYDSPLEKTIRDDTNKCQVVLDFLIGDQEYRLSRTRTKKGSSDLTLLQRNSVLGTTEEVYHNDDEIPLLDKKQIAKYWKDISGSRATDTEKDLAKLVKLTHKAFTSTALFPQNDMTGLPTATPEKRKAILKEALNLMVYTKLEKMAKDRASILNKEIDKNKTLLESLGDPVQDLMDLAKQLEDAKNNLSVKQGELQEQNSNVEAVNDKIKDLTLQHSSLEEKFSSLLTQESTAQAEKSKLETSVKEYQSKRANVTKAAKDLIDEINDLKKKQEELINIDYAQANVLEEKVSSLKDEIAELNSEIKSNIEKLEDAKIPLPSGSVCKTCRKPMTDIERKAHKEHLAKEMESYSKNIQNAKKKITSINNDIVRAQQEINSINLSKKQLESVNMNLASKNKEVADKKSLHEEYSALLQKFIDELKLKTEALEALQEELKKSSLNEANEIKVQIEKEKTEITLLTTKTNLLNKEISHLNSSIAVLQHSIDQKTKDKLKKEKLKESLDEVSSKLKVLPLVIQSFSTTGIPNLIIQNVLDDLQVEANTLLQQLKPGLQLSFSVEKTVEKTGEQADTLEITYNVNGRERYFSQLSGAMKLAVSFSLKLGLSFLLQKMMGADIKFLLLDEVDQALDKASVDAFADIVKFFQKDFTILVITHNDRLKDKFSHAILVEQDINMVSRARVVSSW